MSMYAKRGGLVYVLVSAVTAAIALLIIALFNGLWMDKWVEPQGTTGTYQYVTYHSLNELEIGSNIEVLVTVRMTWVENAVRSNETGEIAYIMHGIHGVDDTGGLWGFEYAEYAGEQMESLAEGSVVSIFGVYQGTDTGYPMVMALSYQVAFE